LTVVEVGTANVIPGGRGRRPDWLDDDTLLVEWFEPVCG